MNSGCLGRLRTTLSSAFDRAINEWQNDCGLSLPKYSIRSSSTCCNCYYSFWNSRQSSVKIFPYNVHILCSKCPPPAEAHAFRRLRKSLIALLIVVCGKSSQICCDALFSSGTGLSLSEVCEMPEALHPMNEWINQSVSLLNDNQVGWGLVKFYHSSSAMKSAQLALSQSCVWRAVWAGAPSCWNMNPDGSNRPFAVVSEHRQ